MYQTYLLSYAGLDEQPELVKTRVKPPHTAPTFAGRHGELYNVLYEPMSSGYNETYPIEVTGGYNKKELEDNVFYSDLRVFQYFPVPENYDTYRGYEEAVLEWYKCCELAVGNLQLPRVIGRAYYRPKVSSRNDGQGRIFAHDPWDAMLIPSEPDPSFYETEQQYQYSVQNWCKLVRDMPLLPPHPDQLADLIGIKPTKQRSANSNVKVTRDKKKFSETSFKATQFPEPNSSYPKCLVRATNALEAPALANHFLAPVSIAESMKAYRKKREKEAAAAAAAAAAATRGDKGRGTEKQKKRRSEFAERPPECKYHNQRRTEELMRFMSQLCTKKESNFRRSGYYNLFTPSEAPLPEFPDCPSSYDGFIEFNIKGEGLRLNDPSVEMLEYVYAQTRGQPQALGFRKKIEANSVQLAVLGAVRRLDVATVPQCLEAVKTSLKSDLLQAILTDNVSFDDFLACVCRDFDGFVKLEHFMPLIRLFANTERRHQVKISKIVVELAQRHLLDVLRLVEHDTPLMSTVLECFFAANDEPDTVFLVTASVYDLLKHAASADGVELFDALYTRYAMARWTRKLKKSSDVAEFTTAGKALEERALGLLSANGAVLGGDVFALLESPDPELTKLGTFVVIRLLNMDKFREQGAGGSVVAGGVIKLWDSRCAHVKHAGTVIFKKMNSVWRPPMIAAVMEFFVQLFSDPGAQHSAQTYRNVAAACAMYIATNEEAGFLADEMFISSAVAMLATPCRNPNVTACLATLLKIYADESKRRALRHGAELRVPEQLLGTVLWALDELAATARKGTHAVAEKASALLLAALGTTLQLRTYFEQIPPQLLGSTLIARVPAFCKTAPSPSVARESWKLLYDLLKYHPVTYDMFSAQRTLSGVLDSFGSSGVSPYVSIYGIEYFMKIADVTQKELDAQQKARRVETRLSEKDIRSMLTLRDTHSFLKFHMMYKRYTETRHGAILPRLAKFYAQIKRSPELYKYLRELNPEYTNGIDRLCAMFSGTAAL